MCQLVLIIQGLVMESMDYSGLWFSILAKFAAQWHLWWSGITVHLWWVSEEIVAND